ARTSRFTWPSRSTCPSTIEARWCRSSCTSSASGASTSSTQRRAPSRSAVRSSRRKSGAEGQQRDLADLDRSRDPPARALLVFQTELDDVPNVGHRLVSRAAAADAARDDRTHHRVAALAVGKQDDRKLAHLGHCPDLQHYWFSISRFMKMAPSVTMF